MFRPSLFAELRHYTPARFSADLTAGLVVGVVALPLSIAFAIASGVSPEKGLVTAVVAGLLVSLLGGSRHQIGGPTGAFIVIVAGIHAQYGPAGLTTATLMAGIILVVMGFARFGSVLKYIPYPVIVGFTGGIALIILASQVKDFLGLQMGDVPQGFLAKWLEYARNLRTINPYAVGVAGLSVAVMAVWPKVTHRLPGSVVALALGTAVVAVFRLPVETIGSRFGTIPSSLPLPVMPVFDPATIKALVRPATTIAILAAIESLLSAVVADGMTGDRHDSDTELVAQGAANIVVPFFGGIPATGAIARTATNIRNGATSPVAGIVHALTLLLVMIFFGKWAGLIPMPVLAAVLVIVAYHMSELRSFAAILRGPRSDIIVLATTFGLTVVFDLTVAIEIGMMLAAFLFMHRMASVSNVRVLTREFTHDADAAEDPGAVGRREIPDGVEVYEVSGSFFFGAATKFKEAMRLVEKPPRVQIVRLRNVYALDSTGIHLLEEMLHNARRRGTSMILSGLHSQPVQALQHSGFLKEVGQDNLCDGIDGALARAREILANDDPGEA
jgi:SulP family sulfate permease